MIEKCGYFYLVFYFLSGQTYLRYFDFITCHDVYDTYK